MRRLSAIAALLALCSCSEQSCSGILVTGGSASLKTQDGAPSARTPDAATPDAGAVANCDQYTTNMIGCYSMDSDDMEDADTYTNSVEDDHHLDCTDSSEVEASAYHLANTPSGVSGITCRVTSGFGNGATNPWSISIWSTNASVVTGNQNLGAINSGDNDGILIAPRITGLYAWYIDSILRYGVSTISADLSHTVWMYDGTNCSTYLNGSVEVEEFACAPASLDDFILGDYQPSFSDAWAGHVSEIRVYSRDLSESEISALYALGD